MRKKQGYVDITGLKHWAISSLEETSHLRYVLALEKANLTFDEFFAKMDTWLKLARSEEFASNSGRVVVG